MAAAERLVQLTLEDALRPVLVVGQDDEPNAYDLARAIKAEQAGKRAVKILPDKKTRKRRYQPFDGSSNMRGLNRIGSGR